ncbi:hypothetical protein H8708_12570 [Lachnospiraceae bacterium BX10]|uniref:Uncharacterized protein n=1 Tax=Enterocloster hominis (ex Liu et al. 2021) TaxID=2763663 RepID=A0ABR7NV86_9FIRM|nr:hypothetical protein [Enterocloster hominis]MBC8600051.1 hypothetical protein [Enterocloster hominis]
MVTALIINDIIRRIPIRSIIEYLLWIYSSNVPLDASRRMVLVLYPRAMALNCQKIYPRSVRNRDSAVLSPDAAR